MAPYTILVGSYAESLYVLEFDPSAKTLKLNQSLKVGYHPSWITVHPTDKSLIYTALEQKDGEVIVLKYAEGTLTELQRAPSGGRDPCTVLASEGELIVGNYTEGNVSFTPLSTSEPYLSPEKMYTVVMPHVEQPGLVADRQESSHPHQVVFTSDESEILVPDLGADKTYRLRRGEDGQWALSDESFSYEAGSGPRHLVLSGTELFTLLELSSHLSAIDFPTGTLIGVASTLDPPPARDALLAGPAGPRLAAELLIANQLGGQWKYLYASNRNDPAPAGDTVAIFSLAERGAPILASEVRTGQKHVRGMMFGGPDDRYLVTGGKDGGGVKVWERVSGGRGLRELASVDVESPTSFLWM
ncbi:3-carboxy-cis,cis-mucoante lactonizing enzyme [Coniophora puteana RWD-64-598 SS2]|uniref:3-carboxy-cis,cis-mucoante lactonizing enzyme n=1 Tax=Coniophora puteana (strain RWD-64-598) TaxID=741705 RepID=A0A5M3MLS9_CONPW|nr:3-carboxy-cis,cis-mucoante lactonizing enzyme [Coniophora puteana RWD-64-598 SS2]EIW80179.1 3-carboxy-cis,cis-mucoante lactonizing enzyme [Coniophora puteana RWD-64-598 SS2]